jgi:ribosomal protein S18 acetylase RimI-like enzyme
MQHKIASIKGVKVFILSKVGIMTITEYGIEKAERELLTIVEKNLYDTAYLNMINQSVLTEDNGNIGIFKAFTYKDSLRFSILVRENPSLEMINSLIEKIEQIISNYVKSKILLWYSQINGFSNGLLERLGEYIDPYRFFLFHLKRKDIDLSIDMKGMTARPCSPNMIDTCIEIMEDVFTPFPDSTGSFRNDKERITTDFLDDRGGVTLFYKDNDLVGFCGHKNGSFTEVVVRKEYQGKGLGETIVRTVLKYVYDMGYDAELTTGHYNERAIALYQKVGFKKVYESIRVTLSHTL